MNVSRIGPRGRQAVFLNSFLDTNYQEQTAGGLHYERTHRKESRGSHRDFS